MSKPKKVTKITQTIQDLVDLAKQVNMPDDYLDGDVRDACDDEADMMFDNLKSNTLRERLEFLTMHGFQYGRLEELIREGGGK